MPLDQLANIAEVLGMLVVAITLIFLAVQMRQNTKAIRSTTAQNAHEMVEALYRPAIENADVADILIRGMRDPTTLSEVETARFFSHWMHGIFGLQNWFYQWRQGTLDEGIWTSYSQILTDIYQTPGIRTFWEQRRQYFSDDFRAYLEKDLFIRPPSPDYRPLGTPLVSPASNTQT